jgi:hypothetical protein
MYAKKYYAVFQLKNNDDSWIANGGIERRVTLVAGEDTAGA